MRISGKIKEIIRIMVVVVVVTLCMLYGFSILRPTPQPNDKLAETAFARTMEHLGVIAKEPHASGFLANRDVRNYLTAQFDQMQLEYESISFQQGSKTFVDYLVKLDAPDTDEGVMFVSHYDSVQRGPGAADDGISVASMLTVLENSVKEQKFKNDLYFLFTDGEELGLIGADYFVKEYKEAYIDKLKLIVNLEARGNQGTLLMFETSAGNYNIADMLRKAVPSGSTPFSFAAALYKRMPNDTDLTRFLEAGFQGMNFAVVRGGENYHTKQDSVENLNQDTAYMYYATTSQLADYLGSMDLHELDGEKEGVYFPVARGRFFLCTESSMQILTMLSVCFFLCIAIYAIVKKRVKWDRLVLTFSIWGIYLVLSYGVVLLTRSINSRMTGSIKRSAQEMAILDQNAYIIQMVLMGITGLFIYILAKKHLRMQEHLLFWGVIFSALCVCSFLLFPAFAYLFCIILFILTWMLVFTVVYRGRMIKWMVPVLAGILCLTCAVLYIPIITALYDSILFIQEVMVSALVLGIAEALLYGLCLACFLLAFQVNPVSYAKRIQGYVGKSLWNQLMKCVKRENNL